MHRLCPGEELRHPRLLHRQKLRTDLPADLRRERGVEDLTLACGTGAGAVSAVMTLLGRVSGDNVKIEMDGGELYVTLTAHGDTVRGIYLTGPTNIVARGEVCDEDICL